jgi:hypothetical protein
MRALVFVERVRLQPKLAFSLQAGTADSIEEFKREAGRVSETN